MKLPLRSGFADPFGLEARPEARTGPSGETPVPHVVAWNLTRRCNLACAHCYISAGSWHGTRGELDTPTALGVLRDVLEVNPSPVLILSGGEPLLREDLEVLAEKAAGRGATVVVGTNGTRLTDARIRSLGDAGVKGVAVSVDSLDPRYHDRFRNAAQGGAGRNTAAGSDSGASRGAGGSAPAPGLEAHGVEAGAGALEATLAAVERCRSHGLDFIVQTTVTRANRDELPDMMRWAADAGAVAFNVYFLVPTGRGRGMGGLSPDDNDSILRELVRAGETYRGRMMVRSKCQPQIMRHAVETREAGGDSALLNYATRCPCGVHYCRITPEGKLTPCPYTPVVAGDLLRDSFAEVWRSSPILEALRSGDLHGKCGDCRYRKVCGGCRARAYATSGDLLGSDASCAYEPRGTEDAVRATGKIRYGEKAERTLEWSDGASARMARVPSFVRGVVTARVERFARERGRHVVDEELMAEVRRSLPVDFSKRLPFFLRAGSGTPSPGASDVTPGAEGGEVEA